ncbi:receptor-type tyrosine-protein phosphatase epsilon-like [Palaemon carinicauda]|uniref:receptor-type tyrosine-protein phosphatase epsilon-like n=1 Tax=Palaemon carinicauda TaxID=392227 RepID=UPI0035B68B21
MLHQEDDLLYILSSIAAILLFILILCVVCNRQRCIKCLTCVSNLGLECSSGIYTCRKYSSSTLSRISSRISSFFRGINCNLRTESPIPRIIIESSDLQINVPSEDALIDASNRCRENIPSTRGVIGDCNSARSPLGPRKLRQGTPPVARKHESRQVTFAGNDDQICIRDSQAGVPSKRALVSKSCNLDLPGKCNAVGLDTNKDSSRSSHVIWNGTGQLPELNGAVAVGNADKQDSRSEARKSKHFPSSNQVKKERLQDYLTAVIQSDILNEEFMKIPFIYQKSMAAYHMTVNRRKNRYTNNFVYDDTRVKLTPTGSIVGSDYINASFIRGFNPSKGYIATQGPKDFNENTIEDFWRMVWEQKVRVIIMLARVMESGKVKVAQYWPDLLGGEMEHGQFRVKLLAEESRLDYYQRKISVTYENESREVIQFQFTSWPDHSVPDLPFSFALMLKETRSFEPTGPMVVHCSAGIGRTGTFLMTMLCLDQLESRGYVDAPLILRDLRLSRPRLVENTAQYHFSHRVLLEILVGQVTSFSVTNFVSCAEDWTALKEKLEKQYEMLRTLLPDVTYKWGENAAHVTMNRSQNILPVDGRQVYLQNESGTSGSQYINAINISNISSPDSIIVTEHPLASTLSKVWRMIFEKKVVSLVILNTLPEVDGHSQVFPALIPEKNDVFGFDNLRVKTEKVDDHQNFTEATVSLHYQKGANALTRNLKVFQMRNWPSKSETPSDILPLLTILDRLDESASCSATTPVVFICSDGVTACGIAVALLIAITRLKLHGEVCIFKAVQGIQLDRPQFITSMGQYMFIHEAMAKYIEMRESKVAKKSEDKILISIE